MKRWQLSIGIALCLILFVLISFPNKESQTSLPLVVEQVETPLDHFHKLRFSSDFLLPYQINYDENTVTISFQNIHHIQMQDIELLDDTFFVSNYFDPQSRESSFTFHLENYPYMYLSSDPTYRKHDIFFQKYPYRILFGKIIVIDPGHGAFDEKTLSIYDLGSIVGDLVESEINLEVSLLLKMMLEDRGAKVYLTREREHCTENPRLLQRFEMVNFINPDIFLSIHQNESEYDYPNGIFVYHEHKEAFLLGQEIMHQTAKIADLKPNHVLNDPLLTLKSISTKKALLIECAFLSNPMDRERYRQNDFTWLLAKGITQGLVKYFENQYFYVE